MGMTIDAVHTLASYLEREWGSTRFIRKIETGPSLGSALAECGAGDGSVWWIATDAFGSVKVYDDTRDGAAAKLMAALVERAKAQTQTTEFDRLLDTFEQDLDAATG